ncbi:MAG TPA: GAF domain-containing protein [Acidisphaera sp.]|nr:GAF domain-containing protein [Acidisphaera sp.]
MLTSSVTPAFGEADLSNCEREQIHLAGSIQPHGALLVVREPDQRVVQASDNTASVLGMTGPPIGRALRDIAPDLADALQVHLAEPLRDVPHVIRCQIGDLPRWFDCLVHRPPDAGVIIELETAGPRVDLSDGLQTALRTIQAASALRNLCDETARLFKAFTGYDRVMVYQFDEQGHGEVFAEEREAHLEPYLGNYYPASDIPHIARRLYERNRIRVLVDVEYAPVGITPRLSPLTGEELDMSLCFLRSSSPIHVQYLKNMGVRATLVVSLMVSGKLWGLISCHHYVPRFLHFEMRAVCEVLAEAVATRIAALDAFAQSQAEVSVRRLEQQMSRAISREGDWRGALFDHSKALLEPVHATGAALLFEGEVRTVGDVPATSALRDIGQWLARQSRGMVVTSSLAVDAPEFAALTPIATGLLAAPISTVPGEYLLWVRPERIRTVTWGGNPFKPVIVGDDPASLSPRRSFSQWHQLVEGTSDPWTAAEIAAARLIRETVSDVVVQFRSVRMLIAADQLEQVTGQVRASDQPVVIAAPDGRILKMNEAFGELLPRRAAIPERLADLLPFFSDSREARSRLASLVEQRRSWRGEVTFEGPDDQPTPLLIRADPVFTADHRTLGFVVLFTDLKDRKQAEAARHLFQESVIKQRRPGTGQLDAGADVVFQKLVSTLVENTLLAGLEIAEGADLARMPELLEAVRASLRRAEEVLRHLVVHAAKE